MIEYHSLAASNINVCQLNLIRLPKLFWIYVGSEKEYVIV